MFYSLPKRNESTPGASDRYDAVLVAGTHIYRADVLMLCQALQHCRIKKVFGGTKEKEAGWFDSLNFVSVPPIGKFTLERTMMMDAVRLHLTQNVNSILVASPRSWMGEALMQLRQSCPDLKITLAVNEHSLEPSVRQQLKNCEIDCDPILEVTRPVVAAKLLGIYRALQMVSPDGQVQTSAFYSSLARADSSMPDWAALSFTGKKRFNSTMLHFGMQVSQETIEHKAYWPNLTP